jgi:NADH-quinone oxidoreductase subunit J
MIANAVFFYAFALLAVLGAVFTISRRSAVHSAVSLIVSLIGVAGIFLLQKAEFLFAVQILLYIGGVVVLFLFVIMLINLDEAASMRQFNLQWPLAIGAIVLAGLVIAASLLSGGYAELPSGSPPVEAEGNTERIADVLFSSYLVPFEVASLVLLVAVIGAVLLARRREPPEEA